MSQHEQQVSKAHGLTGSHSGYNVSVTIPVTKSVPCCGLQVLAGLRQILHGWQCPFYRAFRKWTETGRKSNRGKPMSWGGNRGVLPRDPPTGPRLDAQATPQSHTHTFHGACH